MFPSAPVESSPDVCAGQLVCFAQAAFYERLYGVCKDSQAALHAILRQKEALGRAVCTQVLSEYLGS